MRVVTSYSPDAHWHGERPHYVRLAPIDRAARPGSPDWLRRGGWPYDQLQRPENQSAEERGLEQRLGEILHAEGCPNPLSAAARLIDGPLAELLKAVGWRER